MGVGLDPSLPLFLLVTVTGEKKERTAAMLDCFNSMDYTLFVAFYFKYIFESGGSTY